MATDLKADGDSLLSRVTAIVRSVERFHGIT